jgi:hypothetical protein
VLGDESNNQDALLGMEQMLKSLEKVMKEGNLGSEDDFFEKSMSSMFQ